MTTDQLKSPRKKMSTAVAAEYIGLGKSTLDKGRTQKGACSDSIPYIKIGARVLYDLEGPVCPLCQSAGREASLIKHTHSRVARIESRVPDPSKDIGWVRVIVQSGENQEQAQARYFAEHPEDQGKNVILRVLV
jgi:hypothetical protein